MNKKILASVVLALVAGIAFASASLAVSLSEFPDFLATVSDGVSSPDYVIVVGANAKTSDVVGAVDLASYLASVSYQEKTVPGVTTSEVNGIEKEVPVSQSSIFGTASDQLPTTLKNFHFDGLKDSTFSYRGEDYSFHEEVTFDSNKVVQTHDPTDNDVNGTQMIEILTGDPITYKFVFDEDLDYQPSYDYPLAIELMGKEFDIVGVGSSGIKVLTGSVGMADSEVPVTYDGYNVYVIDGDSGNWAKIKITDSSGTVLMTDILNVNETKTYTLGGEQVKVKLINVWASTITNTVSAKLAVGEEVEKTYSKCTSLGYEDADKYPGEDYWYVCWNDAGTTADELDSGDEIQVIYHPEDKAYYKANEIFKAPNDYFEFGFLGFNTNDFTTITIEKVTDKTLYDSTGNNKISSGLNGFEITADKKGTINGTYDKVYVLFGNLTGGKVYSAYWNSKDSKIEKLGEVSYPASGDATTRYELVYGGSGEVKYYLDFIVTNSSGDYSLTVKLKDGSLNDVATFAYDFKDDPTTSEVPTIKMGTNENEAEAGDITIGSANVGDMSGDIVTDSGAIILAPKTYTEDDKAAFEIPAITLKSKIAFGKIGATYTEGGTYKELVPITSPVAKLDSELTDADKAKNLVVVGGPCANTIAQDLVDLGVLDANFTCAGGVPGSAWTTDTAYVMALDSPYKEGKVVLFVAGTLADDTRAATTWLLTKANYESITASGVKLSTGVTTSVAQEL